MPRILVDADACPFRDEVFRVARRLAVPVVVVANCRALDEAIRKAR